MDENNIFTYDGKDISSEIFYMVDKPHKKYREGFPLDSLSIEMKSMKYYYDLDERDSDNLAVIQGFREFFIKSLEELT